VQTEQASEQSRRQPWGFQTGHSGYLRNAAIQQMFFPPVAAQCRVPDTSTLL
jgi:hypothetical protein